MSTAAAPARSPDYPIRRALPRYKVAVPLDLTVLRSGIPDNIPGRSVDIGQGGVGAVVAAELFPGETVGVQFQLPRIEAPLQARAVVRYQRELFCGLQFAGLSAEQLAMIRQWAEHEALGAGTARPESSRRADSFYRPAPGATSSSVSAKVKAPRRKFPLGRVLWRVIPILVLGTAFAWWRWERGWTEIEGRASSTAAAPQLRAKVPASVMAQRVTHRVEPAYPEAAQQAGLHGPVVLSATVGVDGTVTSLQVVSGVQPLTQAAMEAARWWRFEPYTVNGQPVEVETDIEMAF